MPRVHEVSRETGQGQEADLNAYYSENDPHAAQWLRNLISRGLIAPGDVDERSIEDVQPSDLDGYIQHHFFSGIGAWSYALRLAGWPDDRPVATGSCPCQPFSNAGKREGVADERHLWPAFRWIIAQRRFPVVFGEQVASKDGRVWLAGVRADLETMGYAVGSADLCAAGVGAPHIRQRLWWVAEPESVQLARRARRGDDSGEIPRAGEVCSAQARRSCGAGGVAYTNGRIERDEGLQPSGQYGQQQADGSVVGGLGHTGSERPQGGIAAWSTPWPVDGTAVPCRDGYTRRIESGLKPLVDGTPKRMVIVCPYCNTETKVNENLQYMRTAPRRDERRSPKEVLLGRVLRPINGQEEGGGWAGPGAKNIPGPPVREMRRGQEPAPPSQRQESAEQLTGQCSDSLSEVSYEGTFEGTEAVNVRRVWEITRSQVSPVEKQNLFCPVCQRMGPHQCSEEMGGSRIGELRGYGGAIVPQVAAEFIRAYMELERT